MPKLIDLSGQRFGRLTVIERAGITDDRQARWLCVCDCGSTTMVAGGKLRTGHTKSCGCWRIDCQRETKTTHGDSGKGRRTRLYHIWCDMKYRCYSKGTKDSLRYGDRGITVCEEWKNSFESFRDWAITNGYSSNLSIDRIDVNGNYEPSNCRWSTFKEQCNNRRNNHFVAYNGEIHTLAEWESITGIKQLTIKQRLKRGWSIERALTEPVGK